MKNYILTELEINKILDTLASQPYKYVFHTIDMIKVFAKEERPAVIEKEITQQNVGKRRSK